MEEGIITQAKRLDLVAFLTAELGVSPVATAKGLRFQSCPHCGDSGKGSLKLSVRKGSTSYHCFSCMGDRDSRSIVDAAAAIWGLTPIQAAVRLVNPNQNDKPVRLYVPPSEPAADPAQDLAVSEVTRKLHEVLAGRKNQHVLRYLTNARQIPMHVLQACIDRKFLKFMPENPAHGKAMLEKYIGRELFERAGMWKAGSRAPAILYRPLVSFFPGFDRAEFRLIKDPREGEPKGLKYGSETYPWYFEQDSAETAVVEGIIDMMSLLALGWTGSIIGLPGVNCWKLEWFVSNAKKKGVRRFVSFLDNDNTKIRKGPILNPGIYWTYMLHEALYEAGIEHVPCQPQSGDVNELLQGNGSLSDLTRDRGVLHTPPWLVDILAKRNTPMPPWLLELLAQRNVPISASGSHGFQPSHLRAA